MDNQAIMSVAGPFRWMENRADHLDNSARLLEIDVAEAEGIEFVVHALGARPEFLKT